MRRAVKFAGLARYSRFQDAWPSYRLASSYSPSLSQLTRHFCYSKTLHREATIEHAPGQDGSLDHHPNIPYEPFDSPIIRYEPSTGPSSEQRQAVKHALGIDALGKPAEIFVLDPEQRSRKPQEFLLRPEDAFHQQNDIDEVEILERVNKERGIIDVKDACQHIDDVIRAWKRERGDRQEYVIDRDYALLTDKLRDGFNKLQLQTYLAQRGQNIDADVMDIRQEEVGQTFTRSSWKAGQTPITKTRAPPFPLNPDVLPEAKIRRQYNNFYKEDLVERILSDIWRVRPSTEDLQHGELEIRLVDSVYDLIFLHRDQIVKKMVENYGVKIEILNSSNIIRITSSRDICEDIFRLFKYVIGNIKMETISIDKGSKGNIDSRARSKATEEIGDATKTVIKISKRPKSASQVDYVVYYLGPETHDLEDARRILIASETGHRSCESELFWASDLDTELLSSVAVDVEASLSMRGQMSHWRRWLQAALPEGRPSLPSQLDRLPKSVPNLISCRGDQNVGQSLKEFLGFTGAKASLNLPYEQNYWERNISPERTVSFGQVVFPSPTVEKVERCLNREKDLRKVISGLATKVTWAEERLVRAEKMGVSTEKTRYFQDSHQSSQQTGPKTLQKASNRLVKEIKISSERIKAEQALVKKLITSSNRRFIPMAPGLMGIMSSSASNTQTSEEILITLHPTLSGVRPPSLLAALPILRLNIDFSPSDGAARLLSARFISQQKKLDILFPTNAMDLSAKRHLYVKSKEVDPAIEGFIQQSNLDVVGNHRIRTPDSLTLNVPLFSFAETVGPELSTSVGSPSTQLASVKYTFASLEHHSTLRMPYTHNTSLNYTTIEAGRMGGRRVEFSLSPDPSPQPDQPNQSPHELLDTAEKGYLKQDRATYGQNNAVSDLWKALKKLVAATGNIIPSNGDSDTKTKSARNKPKKKDRTARVVAKKPRHRARSPQHVTVGKTARKVVPKEAGREPRRGKGVKTAALQNMT